MKKTKINLSTMNIPVLHPNIARVFEIALLGNHSVKLVPSTDPFPKYEDVEYLRKYYTNQGADFYSESPQMVIEVTPVDSGTILNAVFKESEFENINASFQRVNDANVLNIEVSDKINEPSRKLLKSAIDKLSLGFIDVGDILSVAKTIAKLSKSTKIEVEHIAEAIQYKSIIPN